MNDLIFFFLYSFLIACFSFVYIIILLDGDGLLGPLYRFLSPKIDSIVILRYIKRPLLDCVHCNAGQISLWFYLVKYKNFQYDLFWHIGFVVLTITFSQILISKYSK